MLRSLSTGQEGTQVMKILGFSAPVLLKCIALIAVLVVFACPLFGKRKDDVVIMKNGDTFTGEIKGLQHGELIFKSDYMKDSVHLDWAQVQTLQQQIAQLQAQISQQAAPGQKSGSAWAQEAAPAQQTAPAGLALHVRRIGAL